MIKILKEKKKVVVLAIAIILAVAVCGVSINANASMSVSAYTVDKGKLDSEVEVNGTVESNRQKVFYSEIDARIGKILVKEGDFVRKGDVIISYDTEDLEQLETMANLQAQADLGSYNNSMQTGSRYAGLYSEAKKNLTTLDEQITQTQEAITRTQNKLSERQAFYADFGAKLQVSLIDWADKPDSEEYENLQKLVATNAYEQQYADDILQMKEELSVLNTTLAELKESKAEMTSQKASTVMGLMTEGAKQQLEAVKEANELTSSTKLADYELAKEGIKADFDGIVTKIGVIEGSRVLQGTELLTLKSTSDIVIKSNVNKYDIANIEEGQSAIVNIKNRDYSGKVSRIERMTKDSGTGSGIGIEITLDEPGDDIILGLEAKSRISTADLDQVIRIPLEALSEDEEGSYVFVAKDGKAAKEFVECGIRNEDMVEIRSGLLESELVVWRDSEEISDGMGIKVSKQ